MTEWKRSITNAHDGTPVLLMLPPPQVKNHTYRYAAISLDNDLWKFVEAFNPHWEEQMFNIFLEVYRQCEQPIPKGQLKWREFAQFVATFEAGIQDLLKAEPRRLGKPPARQVGEGELYDGGTKIANFGVMDDGTLVS